MTVETAFGEVTQTEFWAFVGVVGGFIVLTVLAILKEVLGGR